MPSPRAEGSITTNSRCIIFTPPRGIGCDVNPGEVEVDEEEDGRWRVRDAPPGAPPVYRSAEAQRQAGEESDAEFERQAGTSAETESIFLDDVAEEGEEEDSEEDGD